jgi:serine/threonine protein kinase
MPLFKGRSLAKINYWNKAATECSIDYKRLELIRLKYGKLNDFIFNPELTGTITLELNLSTKELRTFINKEKQIRQSYHLSLEKKYKLAIACSNEINNVIKKGILHRDIKGDNFVGEINPDGKAEVTLIDFGAAIPLPKPIDSYKESTTAGTFSYMAPEVICGLNNRVRERFTDVLKKLKIPPYQESRFSIKSDIYSFARTCILDLGLEENSALGLLQLALSENPTLRPSILALRLAFELDLLLQKTLITIKKTKVLFLKVCNSNIILI